MKQNTMKFQKLVDETILHNLWMKNMYEELGRLVQGYSEVKSTITNYFMSLYEIVKISKDRKVTYSFIIVDNCNQKVDPNCVWITEEKI